MTNRNYKKDLETVLKNWDYCVEPHEPLTASYEAENGETWWVNIAPDGISILYLSSEDEDEIDSAQFKFEEVKKHVKDETGTK